MLERKRADITIYSPTGAEIATVPITEECKRVKKLMEEDSITLSFTLDEALHVPIGSYIDDEVFGRFFITEEQIASFSERVGGYDHTLRFDAWYYLLGLRFCKLTAKGNSGRQEKESDWVLTSPLRGHAVEIVKNLVLLGFAEEQGTQETDEECLRRYVVVDNASIVPKQLQALTIEYKSTSILSAIAKIAEAFECEWWVTGTREDYRIHFGKCQTDSGLVTISLEDYEKDGTMHHLNAESVNVNRDQSELVDKIYVYGSTDNVPGSYRKHLQLVVTGGETVDGLLMAKIDRKLEDDMFTALQKEEGQSTPVDDTHKDTLDNIDSEADIWDYVYFGGAKIFKDMYYPTPREDIITIGERQNVRLSLKQSFVSEDTQDSGGFGYLHENFISNIGQRFDNAKVGVAHGAWLLPYKEEDTATSIMEDMLYGARDDIIIGATAGCTENNLAVRAWIDDESNSNDFSDFFMGYVKPANIDEEVEAVLEAGTYRLVRFSMVVVGGDAWGYTYNYDTAMNYLRLHVMPGYSTTLGITLLASNGSALRVYYGEDFDKVGYIQLNPKKKGKAETGYYDIAVLQSDLATFDETTTQEWIDGKVPFRIDDDQCALVPFAYYHTDYDKETALLRLADMRLRLPDSDDDGQGWVHRGGYIIREKYKDTPDAPWVKETAVAFDNIHPDGKLKVTDCKASDEQKIIEYNDGSTVTEPWQQWHLQLALADGTEFPFSNKYILPGYELGIRFIIKEDVNGNDENLRTSALAGMQFAVEFNKSSHDAKKFPANDYAIVRNNDFGAMLPNEVLYPQKGDVCVLYNWNVKTMHALGLIARAERTLLEKAYQYAEALDEGNFTFTCNMMSGFFFDLAGEYVKALSSVYGDIKLFAKEKTDLYDYEDKRLYAKSSTATDLKILHDTREDKTHRKLFVKNDYDVYTIPDIGQRVKVMHQGLEKGYKNTRIIGYELKLDKPYDTPRLTCGETEAYSRIKQLEKEMTKLNNQ